eukprot:UN12848
MLTFNFFSLIIIITTKQIPKILDTYNLDLMVNRISFTDRGNNKFLP